MSSIKTPFESRLVRVLRTGLYGALLTCAVLGCRSEAATLHKSQPNQSQSTDATKTTLIVAREQGANSLDIHGVGTNRPAYGTSWNIYDRLITHATKTLPDGQLSYDYEKFEPELAERWDIDATGSHITFHLRKDATFHDGAKVTAADVKWSFDRAVTVGGFPSFQMKAGALEKAEQFEVIDPHTFRVHLVRKDKLTLPDLAVPVAAIYNSALAKQHSTPDDPWAMQWLKTNEAGGGAYQIEKFEPGVQEVYTRFEQWRSGSLPKIKRVIQRVIPNNATRRAMIERGDIDVSFDLPPRDFAELANKSNVVVQGVPIENFMWFLDMNVKQPPFDNLDVRRAISYAIPYDQIHDATCFGRCKKLYGAASSTPETIDWPQAYPYHQDLDKSRELLAKAGFPNGFSSKLYFNLGLSTWGEPAALLVQQHLSKVGIQLTLEKIPAANWRGEMSKKTMPLSINDMGGWLNYPDYFFFWNYHGQNAVFNTMNYQNAEMDGYIDLARTTDDRATYEKSVKSFLAKAFADAPRIPLYQSNLDVALSKSVKGYQFWFHRQLDFRQLERD